MNLTGERYFVFYFFQYKGANWTRTLTALAVMLHNTLSRFIPLTACASNLTKRDRAREKTAFFTVNYIASARLYFPDERSTPFAYLLGLFKKENALCLHSRENKLGALYSRQMFHQNGGTF